MSPRQIVPVSDVASILLTQDEGDLRYLPLSYVPPATDLSNYWTKAQADGRYEPIDTMYTKAEADARFQPVGNYQPAGSYSLTSHNHDTAYSAVAHLHTGTYLPLTGGILTGDLTTRGASLNVDADTLYKFIRFRRNSGALRWQIGTDDSNENFWLYSYTDAGAGTGNAFIVGRNTGTLTITPNPASAAIAAFGNIYSYGGAGYYADGPSSSYRAYRMTTGGVLNWMICQDASAAGQIEFYRYTDAGGYAGRSITINRQVGNVTIVSDAGAPALTVGTTRQTQAGVCFGEPTMTIQNDGTFGLMEVRCPAYGIDTYVAGVRTYMIRNSSLVPGPDAAYACGAAGNRWAYVAAANGTIQTSIAQEKKNLKPLDPAACTAAVLGTDWLSFEYIPPAPPPPSEEGQTPAERKVVLDEYVAEQAKTAHIRKQNGYVLGHPTHKTHDLFGLADRQSASPSADLGILACALQAALKRIAVLEGKPV